MDYSNTWIITCGICCIYPIAFHMTIIWIAKYKNRIDWSALSRIWRRER